MFGSQMVTGMVGGSVAGGANIFEETKSRALLILDEVNSQEVVMKRLKRLKAAHEKKEKKQQADPFKKTFLEKIREFCQFDNHQNIIRARLRWFASSDWRKQEVEQAISSNIQSTWWTKDERKPTSLHLDLKKVRDANEEIAEKTAEEKAADEFFAQAESEAAQTFAAFAAPKIPPEE